MQLSDPLGDMLTRIRNGLRARQSRVIDRFLAELEETSRSAGSDTVDAGTQSAATTTETGK